jgi:hypothetical protein
MQDFYPSPHVHAFTDVIMMGRATCSALHVLLVTSRSEVVTKAGVVPLFPRTRIVAFLREAAARQTMSGGHALEGATIGCGSNEHAGLCKTAHICNLSALLSLHLL